MGKTNIKRPTMSMILAFATLVLAVSFVGCGHSSKNKKSRTNKYTKKIEPLSLRAGGSFGKCKNPKKLEGIEWAEALNLANACVKKKDWKKVKIIADHLAKTEFESPWGPYYSSLVAEQEKHFDRALFMIDLAIKHAPKLGLLYYQKGRIRWILKEYGASVTEFNRALEHNANLIDAHLFLGKLYVRDQECPRSVPHWQSVLQVEGKNRDALVGLSKCRLEAGDVDESIVLLKRAIRYYPDELNFRLRMAEIYELEEKDFQRALQTYQRIQDNISSHRSWKAKLKFNLKSKIYGLRKLASINSGNENLGDRKPATKKAGK